MTIKESFDRTTQGLDNWESWFLTQTNRKDLQTKIKAAYDDLRDVSLEIHKAKIAATEGIK